MEVINYFTSDNKDHWLSEIAKSDWSAGEYLATLLREEKLSELVGDGVRVLMLTEGERIISFCTLASVDDVQPTDLTPWIGWIYTFPQYRGNRYAGLLLQYAENLAKADGHQSVYISTNHTGLYEKYGYSLHKIMKDIEGEDTRVYWKSI